MDFYYEQKMNSVVNGDVGGSREKIIESNNEIGDTR